ncbi:MAG: hypothetical protein FWG99_10450 [Treponema sp.]|nr:hypothetical protein [Treponema sp.]
MKRTIIFTVMMAALIACAFGQNYTVQNVTGRVEREAGSQRVAVRAGDSLPGDTLIYTGVGASLVVNNGERTVTVQAARSGRLEELAAAASGIRISGNIARVDTRVVSRTTAQVSTASARASDAAQDEDIAAE